MRMKLVIQFIFTDIQRVKTELYYKRNSDSFMYSWFIYYAMEH